MMVINKKFVAITRSLFLENIRDIVPLLFSLVLPLFFVLSFGAQSGTKEPSSATKLRVAIIGNSLYTENLYAKLKKFDIFDLRIDEDSIPEQIVQDNAVDFVIHIEQDSKNIKYVATKKNQRFGSVISRLLAETPHYDFTAKEVIIPDNPKDDYFRYIFPGILALSLLQSALFGTAAPIINAKERGMYRQFSVAPVSRTLFMMSHVCVRLIVTTLQIALLVAAGIIIFRLEIRNPTAFVIILVICEIVLIVYGYAIAGLFSNFNLASGFLMLLNFYCMTFGQIFIDMSSSAWKALILTTPLSFAVDALRTSVYEDPSFTQLTRPILGLLVYGSISALVGTKYFSLTSVRN